MQEVHGGNIYPYPGILDYSSNINPLGVPESVAACMAQLDEAVTHYPDLYCDRLRERLSHHHHVPMESIICGNGAADLIFRLILAQRPKKAVLCAPCFAEYEKALQLIDANITQYLLEKESFHVQEDIFNCLTEDVDLLVLCNPNNPTGQLMQPELLDRILTHCQERHIFVMIDECFLDFHPQEQLYSKITATKDHPKLLVLRAFTKMYAVPGIRLGYGICGSKKVIEQMYEAGPPWNVSVVAQAVGEVAIQEQEYVKKTIQLIEEERAYFYEQLERLHIRFWKSEANYIFLQSEQNLKEELLKKGFLIRDCSNYHNLEKSYYRIAVKGHAENAALIKAIEDILKKKKIKTEMEE